MPPFLKIFLYFSTSLSFAGNSSRLTWVRHSSSKSSATHSYQGVQCFFFVRPGDGILLPVLGICIMCINVDSWDCTRELYGPLKSLHWKLTLGKKKSLAAPGTRTGVSIASWIFSRTLSQIELFPPSCCCCCCCCCYLNCHNPPHQ